LKISDVWGVLSMTACSRIMTALFKHIRKIANRD